MHFPIPAAISVSSLVRLGAVGLIVVGIIDQSFIPIPGGIDALAIILTAGNRDRWPWYWLMATAGALFGAYLTYRLSKKGGKEALEKRLPRQTICKVEKNFDRGGFLALFITSLMPPPFPMVPVLVSAGALQYSQRKFLLALTIGRVIRYGLITWLAHIYGKQIMRVFKQHQVTIVTSFLVFSFGAALIGWLWTRWKMKQQNSGGSEASAANARPQPKEAA
jgi:membrane protein DedA with SNARE-associated domain